MQRNSRSYIYGTRSSRAPASSALDREPQLDRSRALVTVDTAMPVRGGEGGEAWEIRLLLLLLLLVSSSSPRRALIVSQPSWLPPSLPLSDSLDLLSSSYWQTFTRMLLLLCFSSLIPHWVIYSQTDRQATSIHGEKGVMEQVTRATPREAELCTSQKLNMHALIPHTDRQTGRASEAHRRKTKRKRDRMMIYLSI